MVKFSHSSANLHIANISIVALMEITLVELLMMMVMVVVAVVVVMVNLMGHPVSTHRVTKATQSHCTYRVTEKTARFVPLAADKQGAWAE